MTKENGHGGARKGAGRKPRKASITYEKLTELCELHAQEVIEVRVLDKQTKKYKTEKMSRAHALLNALFERALHKKDVPAIREYFDRTMGRARQQISLDGNVNINEQRQPTQAEIEAAKAYEEAIKRGN